MVKNFRKFNKITETVMALRGQVECDNEYFREHVINFEVVADDYLTEFEKSQLEYEGRITYPAKEIA